VAAARATQPVATTHDHHLQMGNALWASCMVQLLCACHQLLRVMQQRGLPFTALSIAPVVDQQTNQDGQGDGRRSSLDSSNHPVAATRDMLKLVRDTSTKA